MNAERLLEVYEQISEAPDAIARLRRFVLDLAVRGKLVEQDAADEPASQLLEQIAVEKAKLVSSGHIKAPKPQKTKSAIEAEFAIPSGWVWTSLGTVAACLDFMRKPINGTERDKRIDGLPQDKLYPYFGATQQQGWIDDFIFDDDLVLLGEDGVPFHDPLRNKAYKISGKTWVNNHAHVFKCILTSIDFVAHYLNVFDYSGRVVGATRAKLNQARALTIPIPLPPLAEQHRIVAKVDELMALCDRLEKARKTREELRDKLTAASLARLTAPDTTAQAEPAKVGTGFASGSATSEDDFPTHAAFALEALPALTTRPNQIKILRQTILNLAVRGKLVEQDPADEPASALLAKINSVREPKKTGNSVGYDLPFPVPLGWARASVQDTLLPNREISYGVIKLGNEPKTGGIPTLRCSDVRPGYIETRTVRTVQESIEEQYIRTRLEGGEVLINIRGTLGGVAEVPKSLAGYNIAREVAVIPVSDNILAQYIVYLMLSPFFWDHIQGNLRGIAYKGVNLGTLRALPIPIPPLAEQHRIVAKVDALKALCDRLEAALITADTTRTRLLEALLQEALEPVSETMEAAE
ncbi:restriction endonuclease subunit S [Sulfitobacter sp. AS92]|uniref:restriction endonuclease subunit S n=1 Tax=Sulfitobacter sp. AS92 TaxID=3135783 RepID=UPI00316BA019